MADLTLGEELPPADCYDLLARHTYVVTDAALPTRLQAVEEGQRR